MRFSWKVLLVTLAIAALLVTCVSCVGADGEKDPDVNSPRRGAVGGKLKGHLCLGSAGYVWCEAKNRCLRLWEEECAGWEQQDKKY